MQALNEQILQLEFLPSCIAVSLFDSAIYIDGTRESSCRDSMLAMSCTCAEQFWTRLTVHCEGLYGVRMQALNVQILRLKFRSSCIAV